jgi:hypothetical protein
MREGRYDVIFRARLCLVRLYTLERDLVDQDNVWGSTSIHTEKIFVVYSIKLRFIIQQLYLIHSFITIGIACTKINISLWR